MGNVGNWVLGGLSGLIALLALYMSSHSKDTHLYEIGLIVAGLSTLYIFHLIKTAFDDQEH